MSQLWVWGEAMKTQTYMHPEMVVDGKKKCLHWINVTCALRLPPRCDLLKSAVPPCEVGTLTVTILLLAGSGSLVVTTFPLTEVPVMWKVCPPDVATVVSVPAPNKANKQTITTNTVTTINPTISLLLINFFKHNHMHETEKQYVFRKLAEETRQHCRVHYSQSTNTSFVSELVQLHTFDSTNEDSVTNTLHEHMSAEQNKNRLYLNAKFKGEWCHCCEHMYCICSP